MQNYYCPTKILMGAGVHAQAAQIVKMLGAERVLIIADGALLESEVFSGITQVLDEDNIGWALFTEVEQDPSDTTVEKALAVCQDNKSSALIALGGGSAIDVAKAVGILMTNGGRIHDYEGIRKFEVKPLPLVAVPTTAGTGSEVSGSCVITDSTRHLKMSIRHAELNPASVALLDPLAVKTLPAHVAMHAGMDAFVHAFESYISLNANPITDAMNLHALELLSSNLLPFVANRSNEEAALNMLCSSSLAGMAFGITGLGNVHCISRFIGAYFHLSHGLSNALCLPHVAEFNRIAVQEKYARLAETFGCDVRGLPVRDAAVHTVRFIQQLCADLDVPPRLREVGVQKEKFEEIAKLCLEANYNRWNPRYTSQADFLRTLNEAY
ncbi:iron-containing alcohol dehydrogenase [Salinicola sp. MIT1003]|uniref:iron-containing alcohol dehydrogenase n=1 Tax=Salinicola sp. MIT1003 TaxID=1882734 RepID=UPI000B2A37A7|nr:iron-containing alcohol dehydrogenase [Salinicola sp. MIT1003]